MATLESIESSVLNLTAAVHELLARIPGRIEPTPGTPSQPATDYARFDGGPRVVEVKPNIRMKLVAPVNPDYEPPFIATITGRDFDGDPSNGYPVANEPSNARADQPPRDMTTGYPLFYGAGGVAYLMNAEGGFLTLDALLKERADRLAKNAQAAAEWAARYGPR